MKKIKRQISAVLIVSNLLLFWTSCKKDLKVCDTITELSDRKNLVDPNSLGSQALIDTLSKHPEVQVYDIISSQYGWTVKCNVFYKDIKVFSSQYFLHKNNYSNSIICYDTLNFNSINFSLIPSITKDKAIKISKQKLNFNKTCISYRLGIYDLNARKTKSSKNYKLTWKVQGENGYPYVVIDANSGQVITQDDGIRQ